jgi:signal transduction histidine kinase
MNPKLRRIGLYLSKIILLAIIYHLAARIGLRMAYVQANTSPVWPPTGISLAALLLFGINLWPGVTLGVLLGSLFTGAPAPLALGMSIGNTLEAVAAVWVLKRFFDFHNTLDRLKDVTGLLLVAFFGTMISAIFGVATLVILNPDLWSDFGPIWTTWWIGDLLGALVVAPLLLTWLTPPWKPASKVRMLEGVIAFILLIGLTWIVFSNNPPAGIFHLALLYVIFPLMIWIALRFGTRGAATGLFLVSGIAIWGTIHELGPFSHQPINDSLVLLQTFTGVVSITSLILAATTAERLKANIDLHQKVADLAALNQASETFLGTFNQEKIYQTICQVAVRRFGLEVAWIEIAGETTEKAEVMAIQGATPQAVKALNDFWHDIDIRADGHKLAVRTLKDRSGKDTDNLISGQAYAELPLLYGTQSIGRLKLISGQEGFFTPDREVLLHSFANLAVVTIQNSWLLEKVRRGNEQLHALSQRLMRAQEEERLHLSRELHDESGQLLAALMVELGLLEREDAANGKQTKSHIARLRKLVNEIQDNLHQLAVNLRPASLDHLGLVSALEQYVAEFSRQYDIPVNFESIGIQGKRLGGDIETALFRIVQESLTNVVLHAQAHQVDILINRKKDQLVAVIEDDGVGFVPSPPGLEDHLGLFGMRERVEMLGGRLTLESSPGKGTTVRVEVPCND